MTASHAPQDQGGEGAGLPIAAFEHHARLVRFVAKRLSAAEAADVVQDAYVRLVVAAQRTPVHNTAAFLFTTVRNLLTDRARAAATRSEQALDPDRQAEVACQDPHAEQALIGRQKLAIVERALQELPPSRRAALVLHRLDGLPHAAIADQLGISVSMVEKHVRLALDHCRKRLAQAEQEDAA